jgi:chromosome segregation ATPase
VGIRSEIRTNRLASDLGITRLEIFVDELDVPTALKVRQDFEGWVSSDKAAANPGGDGRIHSPGLGICGRSDLVTEVEVLPPSTELLQEESPSRCPKTDGTEAENEFAEATALLEKEVEELLVRESKLVDRCSSLEEKVKTLDELLAQARVDLARKLSHRSNAEKKLTEACEARASLVKEMQRLEARFKASEQALATSQGLIESQTRRLDDQRARIANLERKVSSRDAELERIAESLTKARAGMDQKKGLRLPAEQKSADLAAGRKSQESQLAQQVQRRGHSLSENRDEQEQMRACVGKVIDLRSRLRSKLAANAKQYSSL